MQLVSEVEIAWIFHKASLWDTGYQEAREGSEMRKCSLKGMEHLILSVLSTIQHCHPLKFYNLHCTSVRMPVCASLCAQIYRYQRAFTVSPHPDPLSVRHLSLLYNTNTIFIASLQLEHKQSYNKNLSLMNISYFSL